MTAIRFNSFATSNLVGQLVVKPDFVPRGTVTASGAASITDRLVLRLRVPVAPNKRNPKGAIFVTVSFFGKDAEAHHSAMAEAFNQKQWVVVPCEYNQWVNAKGVTVPDFIGHSAAAIGGSISWTAARAQTGAASSKAAGFEPPPPIPDDATEAAPWDTDWPDAMEDHDAAP